MQLKYNENINILWVFRVNLILHQQHHVFSKNIMQGQVNIPHGRR